MSSMRERGGKTAKSSAAAAGSWRSPRWATLSLQRAIWLMPQSSKIHFEGCHFRRDIALAAVEANVEATDAASRSQR